MPGRGRGGRGSWPVVLTGWEPMLCGRSEQLAAIDRLLEGMRSSRAGVLVLRGEAGIGKTALLDAASEKASGARVLRVTGVEPEAELPFAALHALLRPALDEIGALPRRQAEALRGAFGLAEEAVADRFLVGLGVLSLIAELAEDRPVLVLADDAQWLDRASGDALAFAARRLYAERAAVLVAARDEPPGAGLPGLPELRVGGLDRAAAEQLLAGAGLVAAVRDQLIAEAGGNPLALIELSRGLSGPQRAGSVTPLALPAASPAGRVQQAFAARIGGLPQECRRAMLVAALGGMADLAEVSRAVAAAGGSLTDLAAAERAGLVRVTPAGVSFGHPLARAAVLAGSDVAERAAGHRALAGVLDGDRRAWHLAALADGPGGQVAAAAALPPPPPTNGPPRCRTVRRPGGAGWRWPPRRRPTPGSSPGPRAWPGRPGSWWPIRRPPSRWRGYGHSWSSRPVGPPTRQASCWSGPRCSARRTQAPRRRWWPRPFTYCG